MKLLSKAAKIGMYIMPAAGAVMAVPVVISKAIPNVVAWIFVVGAVLSLASALFSKKN